MRVVLETPLWSYVGQHSLREDLERMAAARKVTICTPPSVLVEVLRMSRSDIRDRIIDALSSPQWRRLMVDAFAESADVLQEIERLRPHWLRQEGARRVDRLARARQFWARDIWRMAGRDPEKLRAQLGPTFDPTFHNYAESHIRAQATLRAAGHRNLGPQNIRLSPKDNPEFEPGWRGDPIASWRVEACHTYWGGLAERAHLGWRTPQGVTFIDWTDAYVWPSRIAADRASFNSFWYYEVEAARVPRCWLHTNVAQSQYARRIDENSAWDWDHANYLFDCDLFLTSDRRFVYALEAVTANAPVPLAAVACIAVLPDTIPRVVEFIEAAVHNATR